MTYTSDLFHKLKNSLLNTRKKLGDSIVNLINNKKINLITLNDLENQLICADISIQTTHKIINNFKNNIHTNYDKKLLQNIIYNELIKIVIPVNQPLHIQEKKPFIILTIGVNGVGKTTTIGKLAYYYQKHNKTVMLAAGDTRRAAAIDQLKILGNLSNCIKVIANHPHSDPASVIFDAIQIAKSKLIDILIIDTAGRLQNDTHSMNELNKIIKTIKKIDSEAPHETILVLDANTGHNSINQVQTFNKIIKITGIIMTKLDGSAKGGALLSIADCCPIPIRYIGIGQHIKDLQPFKPHDFISAIFTEKI